MMLKPLTQRQEFEILRGQLENERSSFLSHWRDLGDFISPRRPRFTVTDVNRGERKNLKIVDTTPSLAARTLRSGMMSGITSPARPWFRLTTTDPDRAESSAVKDWLGVVTQRMAHTFLRSNAYNILPIVYGDMGTFATSAFSIEEDFTGKVMRFQAHPIGSYMIANDENLQVRTFFREFRMTVRQMIGRWGIVDGDRSRIDWSRFSTHVKSLWTQGQAEAWIDVRHVIDPNPIYDKRKPESKFKEFRSCYYEAGTQVGGSANYMDAQLEDRYLSEKGYDYYPVLCPRWEVNGEDVYGTDCPGMTALGDIKQLMTGEKRSAEAIDKMVRPPMTGPTSLRSQRASILPGDITYVDAREGQQGFRPSHEVNPKIQELEAKQAQVRERVRRAYYEDLFLMMAESDRRDITAREIDERHEEKLLALGPVLEQLNQDALDPMIDIAFNLMERQGEIPPPPPDLEGQPLKVEYISIMAQAQKLAGIAGVERFAGFVGQVATVTQNPDTLDKVNIDRLIDAYGEMTSVPPGIVRSEEDLNAIRAQKQKAAQSARLMETLQQGADTAKSLSQANTGGDNALTALLQQTNAGALAPA